MKHLRPYFTFNGNCREAMHFYQECLGGSLSFQTVGDSPLSAKMPQHMQQCILHTVLTSGDTVVMGTDMVQDEGRIRGNSLAMMLDCESEAEARAVFQKLASGGGQVLHELETTFWGALFGDLKDKHGNTWLIHADSQPEPKNKF